MRVGLALPQFELSGGGGPVRWQEAQECARLAENLGFESLWLADHGYDPLVALGALARATERVRLGTLVLDAALRPPAVLTKALATIDVVSGGRLVVGLGAADEQGAAQLAEACQVVVGMFGGGPFSFTGAHVRITDARCLPLPVQRPHPPIWVDGSSDDLLDVVARHCQGWNAGWLRTPGTYRERLTVLEAACERAGRDPATITRSLGLSTLVGEDGPDLQRRFRHLCESAPVAGATLDEWRQGRLVGTVEEVGGQLTEWETLGVDTVVLGPGAVPFSAIGPEDVSMLAAACSLKPYGPRTPRTPDHSPDRLPPLRRDPPPQVGQVPG